MTDISRQCTAHIQHLANRNSALYDETVVQAYQCLDPRTDHQVIAYRNLCHTITHIIQHDIQERSIQYNVAVIGNKCTRLFVFWKAATSGDRQRESCLVCHVHNCLVSQFRFEIFLCLKRTHRFGKFLPIHIRFDIPKGPLEIFVGNERLNSILYLVVVQRTNVVKIIGNFCIHIF